MFGFDDASEKISRHKTGQHSGRPFETWWFEDVPVCAKEGVFSLILRKECRSHLHKLGVDLSRERWVSLELRPHDRQIQGGDIRNEDDSVGVAHAHASNLPIFAVNLCVERGVFKHHVRKVEGASGGVQATCDS